MTIFQLILLLGLTSCAPHQPVAAGVDRRSLRSEKLIPPSSLSVLVVKISCQLPPHCAARFYHATNCAQPLSTWAVLGDSSDGRITVPAVLPCEIFTARAVDLNTGIESDFAHEK